MTDEKKTLKFQMMMSPTEAEQLDNWMFENRLRSRAEAIRRLCQIGLSAEDSLTLIQDWVDTVSQKFSGDFKEAVLELMEDSQELKTFTDKCIDMNLEQIEELTNLFRHLIGATTAIRQISALNNTDDAIQVAMASHLETAALLKKIISEINDGSTKILEEIEDQTD